MKSALFPLLLLSSVYAFSQQNIRAWYAQGQVWIVWEAQPPLAETVGIYKSSQPFENTNLANAIGRLFAYEYLPGTFIQQTNNPDFTYKIPRPDGTTYTLAKGECLFVETVAASGSAYYAVVPWGSPAVTAGVNGTQDAVSYTYDPAAEPVNCHLQMSAPLSNGLKANWYCVWLLGKQEYWAGRPDFPVMANLPKNGMPAMFIVSEAFNMDTSGGRRIPATHWFHGGGGTAIQQTADKAKFFDIAPQQGISISHNDDLPQMLIAQGDTLFSTGRTAWFGWAKAHNPFNPGFDAGPGDTIINYTQRRILWINNWLINHYRVDPDRVALQGYSMGSGGASALGKAFPGLFSTVCAFNNGFRRVNEETIIRLHGSVEENLPTNLRNANNQVIHMNEVMDMNTPTSAARDLPLFRTWAGKNDSNDRMHWGPDLVAQYRMADSLGWGMQINWDERPHVYDTLGFHWIFDLHPTTQTYRDNLAYQEQFNSKQSFPAFFNHRLYWQNNDPGVGLSGIDKGDGDNWGAWGGYHNWDLNTIKDEAGKWEVTAWLTNTSAFGGDISPVPQLQSDVAIRKPQSFRPEAGKTLQWVVKDAGSGALLQNGTTTVRPDGLVVIPQVFVYRENIHKIRISVTDPAVAAPEPETTFLSRLRIEPNPSFAREQVNLHFLSRDASVAQVTICALDGVVYRSEIHIDAGENHINLPASENLPAGFYVVQMDANGARGVVKWIKF